MARKQARRRKQKKAIRFRMPSISIARILTPMVAVLIVYTTYHVSGKLLDRPIGSISVNGPFQRVTALQIEEAISEELDAGFFGADVGRMQQRIQALTWIDGATVARRWPNRIAIGVTEQVPAATWGESGLFVTDVRHVPAELPRLSGPDDRSADVARRYLAVRAQLIPLGLDVRRVQLDARGAWDMTLTNGVDIRLGRRDVEERTSLFLDVVANIITGRAADIDYVDMRYSNGWNDGAAAPATDPGEEDPSMLASRGKP